uniref:POU-specific domain-containing protein n=1 Tax=Knipowitschia caucasica TaxID=637954 RepID=A0AAV2JCV5_KNICA
MTTMTSMSCTPTSSSAHLHHPSVLSSHHHHHQPQGLEGDLLDHLTPGLALGAMTAPDVCSASHGHHMSAINHMQHHHHAQAVSMHAHGLSHGGLGTVEAEPDPRELESFAERFKQRRIKLGVTQADVGSALANLKIPGVGCLSQSTICRFESLTLSHNNMVALKPILEAWLEEAERAQREKMAKPEIFSGADKKRKRTSIAAPEKRSLEAYFAVQPRPSSEKIAAIAEKLDLKKNVTVDSDRGRSRPGAGHSSDSDRGRSRPGAGHSSDSDRGRSRPGAGHSSDSDRGRSRPGAGHSSDSDRGRSRPGADGSGETCSRRICVYFLIPRGSKTLQFQVGPEQVCGAAVERLWSGCGAAVERLCSGCGAAVERLWSGCGAAVERLWSGCGAAVEQRLWSGCGAAVERLWSGCGAAVEPQTLN